MEIPLVDLKTQYRSLKKPLQKAFDTVMRRTDFILGGEVSAFEKEFASFCRVPHAVSCASGTDALHLALLAAGIGRGDDVLTVSNSWISTTLAVLYTGAKPVFVDVDPRTYVMDASLLKRALTRRTRAILPVHLYGHPAPMDAITDFARKKGLVVVEDAAQSHGAAWGGTPVGGFGHMACYSFYPSKNLGACGDGGAVTTADKKLAEKILALRNYGQKVKNVHGIVGYNSRLDTLQAALLRVKLRRLHAWTEARRRAAKRYTSLLAPLPCVRPVEAEGARHVYHCYVVQVARRNRVLQKLQEEGVRAQVHYPTPIHRQACLRPFRVKQSRLPVAEAALRKVISLPIYPEITPAQQAYVAQVLRKALR